MLLQVKDNVIDLYPSRIAPQSGIFIYKKLKIMLPNRNFNKTFMPINIDVKGKKIVLIGGGRIAYHKLEGLLQYADTIELVAPEVLDKIKDLPINIKEKYYEASDLYGAILVYACTNISELNSRIKLDAAEKNILVNVVDNPVHCDFTTPAIYRKGYINVAVSSNAQNVYESIEVRNKIKNILNHDTIN